MAQTLEVTWMEGVHSTMREKIVVKPVFMEHNNASNLFSVWQSCAPYWRRRLNYMW